MNVTFLGPRTFYYLLMILGIVGCVGSGLFNSYMMIFEYSSIRWTLVHFYNIFFSLLLISGELQILEHPILKTIGMVLRSYVGRASVYFFVGGLQLDGWGYIPGIWMLAVGALNILALCFCGEQLKKVKDDNDYKQRQAAGQAPTPLP